MLWELLSKLHNVTPVCDKEEMALSTPRDEIAADL
jgi:hypothetical protein